MEENEAGGGLSERFGALVALGGTSSTAVGEGAFRHVVCQLKANNRG